MSDAVTCRARIRFTEARERPIGFNLACIPAELGQLNFQLESGFRQPAASPEEAERQRTGCVTPQREGSITFVRHSSSAPRKAKGVAEALHLLKPSARPQDCHGGTLYHRHKSQPMRCCA